MKIGTFLILQTLFTAGALVVYDTVKSDGTQTSASAPAESQPTLSRPEQEPPSAGPVLVGAGMDDLMRRIGTLERQLAAQAKPGATAAVVEGSGTAPAERSGAPELPFEVGTDPAAQFDPQHLATFRAMQEIVEKQRQEERRYNMYRDQIRLLQLNLTPDQEKVVITTTIARDQKRGEALRELGPAGDREARVAAREAAQTEWQQAIEAKLPTFEAQKIVEWGARSWGGMARREPGGGADIRTRDSGNR
jgi:hypothetical protein